MMKMNLECSLFARYSKVLTCAATLLAMAGAAIGQQSTALRDPAEPSKMKAAPKVTARPTGAVARVTVDVKGMKALIAKLVACGTRLTISSWDDPKRGIGCGRDTV